jgi:hypothetical protein
MSADPACLIVVAPTFYTCLEDVRYRLALEACQNAAYHKITVILVDASPTSAIREGLVKAGDGYVEAVPQTAKGRKGAALREAIGLAFRQQQKQQQHENSNHYIAFQELEKVDMFRHWLPILQHMIDTAAQVTVPRRADACFRSTYPMEQYHAESFANAFLSTLGQDIGLVALDWTMGPVALRSDQVHHWINYVEGELWDVQLIPLIQAHLAGAKVTSLDIDYLHPESMKDEEQGDSKWNQKRLMQLNFLNDTVGKFITDVAMPSNNQ